MSDSFLSWGGDLQASATGDVYVASEVVLSTQRIVRRLLTNPKTYIWNPDYGAGLGALVGAPAASSAISATIYSQLLLEPTIAQMPPPTVTTAAQCDGSVFVTLTYAESIAGSTQTVSITLGN